MAQVTLQVHGLDCAEEVALLREQLRPLPGVHELSFDILRGRTTIAFDDLQVDTPRLIDEVRKTGLRAVECCDKIASTSQRDQSDRQVRFALCLASGLLGLAGMIAQFTLSGGESTIGGSVRSTSTLALSCDLLATICGLWLVFPKAASAILRMRPDMNLLMMIAAAGAFCIGESSEAAAVAFLFSLSLVLESWSVERARRAIESLMTLAPTVANFVTTDGAEEQRVASQVDVGSTIRIRPGDVFPLDGLVIRGDTTVNQAPITGESIPVSKSNGSQVFAGTINVTGAVDVQTSRLADDSVLSHILRLVSEARKTRSTVEQSVERFAGYYTPIVMTVSLLVIGLPPLVFHGSLAYWFYQGLVLLVIACPCALVISTPVSVVAALTSTAKQGVLVKGGRYLELAARLKAVAFDKTGTLTIGQPQLCQVIPLNGFSEANLLEIAGAIGLLSQHPLARAISEYASSRATSTVSATDFESLSGHGASAIISGRRFWIGSFAHLKKRGLATPELQSHFDRISEDAASIVVVSDDKQACGLITLSDMIRPNAAAAVAALRQVGVEQIVMLTGDNSRIGTRVCEQAGVKELRAELLPEDKVAVIQEFVRQYEVVAMVGDGVNDAPAMAQASLGIAMGHVGTDAALETADVVLMNDDLSRIPWMIGHARRMRQIIRQNIVAALAVKVGFVILTLVGYASLWSAIIADTGMSLIVVMNALRLLVPTSNKIPE